MNTFDFAPERTWLLTVSGRPTLRVAAPNWLAALGLAMEQVGCLYCVERLVTELRDDGSVRATDAANGRRFLLQEVRLGRLAS